MGGGDGEKRIRESLNFGQIKMGHTNLKMSKECIPFALSTCSSTRVTSTAYHVNSLSSATHYNKSKTPLQCTKRLHVHVCVHICS